jgi:hypothetical protein
VTGPPPQHVTWHGDTLDEVYLAGVHAHLERLSSSGAYLHLWDDTGRAVHLDLVANRGRLLMSVNVCDGVDQEVTE